MNKDADERTLKPGEYRDALNIQLSNSGLESGDAGSAQNIQGTTKINVVSPSGVMPSDLGTCVGIISDTSNDKLYYFIKGDQSGSVLKDYIIEYDAHTQKLKYVFVDIYKVTLVAGTSISSTSFNVTAAQAKTLRPGMFWNQNGIDRMVVEVDGTVITLDSAVTVSTGADMVFTHPKVLDLPSKLITGINILDGTLFWTDNATEPKRIQIERCIAGTGGTSQLPSSVGSDDEYVGATSFSGDNADYHTRFTTELSGSLQVGKIEYTSNEFYPSFLELVDVTVIRKPPVTALKVEAYNTVEQRENPTDTFVLAATIWSGSHPPGEEISGLTFTTAVDFRFGDIVTFSALEGPSSDGRVDVRARITAPSSLNENLNTSGHVFTVIDINPNLTNSVVDFLVTVDQGEALLDDKLARFSYRYKYQDGEYSTFAPWSQVVFRPGTYNYLANEGFNKGMVNTIRNVRLSDFATVNVPKGVTHVDLLYKETNNPTVYSVKTLELSAKKSLSWSMKTDLVHALLPSDQILRAWDNVPREALAQEVSANRIIYGNYLQNYNVENDIGLNVDLVSSPVDVVETTLGGQNSVKSMREYQVGVVFSDKYGRETPVITDETSYCKVPIQLAPRANKLQLSIKDNSMVPSWADYYSFYIKEPSVEYYTLAMDRWYNAADGNAWISFPSSERNKITDETFLYLKKAHGNNTPVTSGKEYKVLAIEDEAPEYIKMLYQSSGFVRNSQTSDSPPQVTSDQFGNEEGGYPLVGTRVIHVPSNNSDIEISEDATSFGQGSTGSVNTQDSYRVRFFASNNFDATVSKWYDVDKITNTNDKYFFHLHGALGEDLAFATVEGEANIYENRIQNANNEGHLNMQVYKGEAKNRPEFDGRFFVKIAKDNNLINQVMSFEGDDWVVFDDEKVAYINNNPYTDTTPHEEPKTFISTGNWHGVDTTGSGGSDNTLSNTDHPTEVPESIPSGESAYSWSDTSGVSAADVLANTHSAINGPGDNAKTFWENRHGNFFIDRCSTYSLSGRHNHFPGNYYDSPNGGYDEGYWQSINGGLSTTLAAQGLFDNEIAQSLADFFSGQGFPFIYTGETLLQQALTNVRDTSWNSLNQTQGAAGSPLGLPSRGMWNEGDFGYMDISWSGFSDQLGYMGNNAYTFNQQLKISKIDDDNMFQPQADFIEELLSPGCKFRFSKDPDKTVYTVESYLTIMNPGNVYSDEIFYTNPNENVAANWDYNATPDEFIGMSASQYRNGHFGIRNYKSSDYIGQWEPMNRRQRWTIKVTPGFGEEGVSQYTPTTGTQVGDDFTTQVRALHHDGTNFDTIQILQPTTVDEDGNDASSGFVPNPAVFETKPKESVDLDIYYQCSDIIPLRLKRSTKSNEEFIPIDSTVKIGDTIYLVEKWDSKNVIKLSSNLTQAVTDSDLNFVTTSGRTTVINVTGALNSDLLTVNNDSIFPVKHKLTWNNCWSFGNGVESDRIRDDYNAGQMDNGVKASSVLTQQIKEERRSHGIIWSGIYNSANGINESNQFGSGGNITKDLNPSYGSIQRLLNKDTRLVMFCEDKVLRSDTNKDMLYNADGTTNLIASDTVVGDASPYAGDYGISKNPESLATSPASTYWADAVRGKVLSLTGEGIVPISDKGMEGFFSSMKDWGGSDLIGTFDASAREYNLSTILKNSVSYNERSKSWVSFKSFLPEAGLSLNNDYYTFSDGLLWLHHSNSIYNYFYDKQYKSSVTTIFTSMSGDVESFNAISYSGSKGKVSEFISSSDSILTGDYSVNLGLDTNETTFDGEYFNLSAQSGWYVESIKTDMQKAGITEFKEKEGKWFGVPSGDDGKHLPELDRLSTQGLGLASTVTHGGSSSGEVTVTLKNAASSSSGYVWD